MRQLKNQKGFTLIELAIVLVIIGIILGAVLKGQDLIQNARAKQFISKVKAWEIAQWTYYDRKGKFAGAKDSGLIGENNGDVKDDLTKAKFINPPYEVDSTGDAQNKITLGSYVFYVYFGNDTTNKKNIMTICSVSNCGTVFTDDIVSYAEALDISIDGIADGTTGQVIGNTQSITPDTGKWVANFAPTSAAWTSSPNAIVYYFDAKR